MGRNTKSEARGKKWLTYFFGFNAKIQKRSLFVQVPEELISKIAKRTK